MLCWREWTLKKVQPPKTETSKSAVIRLKEIKIYGKYYPVEAKIVEIEGLSAHGDQKDLLEWLSELEQKPETVFLVHGETEALTTLQNEIEGKYQFRCEIPYPKQIVEIN